MIKRSKNLVIIALILGLVISIVTGCGSKKDKQTSGSKKSSVQQSRKPIPVKVKQADIGNITKYITVTGTAKPVKSTEVTPELQEQADKVLIEVGDKIKKGEKLVQLNQEDVQAQVEEAKAALETAKAGLNELLAGTRQEKIDRLEAQLKQTAVTYKQAKKDYERYKKLFKKEVISKQDLETIKNQYISAESNYQAAKEELKMAKNGPTKEQIAAQKAQVKQTKTSLNTAKLNLAKTEITAPIAGVIAEVNIEEGETVSAQQPVVSIIDLNPVEIKTYISEQNINKLDIGQEVSINFSALDKELTGKIKTISPALDTSKKKFPVEIRVDNSSQLIKSGMYATVKLKTDVSSGKIVLSKKSIIQEDGTEYVYIAQNGRAVKKEVTTGLATKEKVVILAGVSLGDQVITEGSEQVTDGYGVTIVGGGGQ
ncbi:hypothetical protein JCM16358_02750 [Halanaerocella petrolearia]